MPNAPKIPRKISDLDLSGITDGQFLKRVGSDVVSAAIPGATPAGSDRQIQINDAGAFGAVAGFSIDSAGKMTLAGIHMGGGGGPSLSQAAAGDEMRLDGTLGTSGPIVIGQYGAGTDLFFFDGGGFIGAGLRYISANTLAVRNTGEQTLIVGPSSTGIRSNADELQVFNNAGFASALNATTLNLGIFTVGTLPLAASFPGGRALVTDALATPTFADGASAGGTTYAPVYSTGSAWIYG